MRKNGDSLEKIAERFNIDQSTVSRICSNNPKQRRWLEAKMAMSSAAPKRLYFLHDLKNKAPACRAEDSARRAEPQHESPMSRSDGLSHSASPAGNHNYYCQCLGFDERSLGIYVEAESVNEAWDTASELLRVKEVTSVQRL